MICGSPNKRALLPKRAKHLTESKWLKCSDSWTMLVYIRRKTSTRKLRLFIVACCRRVWHLLSDERSRQVVELAELCADGLAEKENLETAGLQAHWVDALTQSRPRLAEGAWDAGYWAAKAATCAAESLPTISADVCWCPARAMGFSARAKQVTEHTAPLPWTAIEKKESRHQTNLLRCIIGSPFRPVTTDSAWLAWNQGTVQNIAQAIYDERAFDLMPILADALEEAGCDNDDILAHCRQPGEHVRGCWVLDLLLGK